jgi:RNA polymerase sigma-70 factor (ECF subfamily)
MRGHFLMAGKNSLEKQISDCVTIHKENYYRLAYSYVKDVDDALDIVQESIYKAMTSIDYLNDNKNIEIWFYRIIVNNSLDLLRMQGRIKRVNKEALKINEDDLANYYQDIELKLMSHEIHIPRELEIVVENALRGSSLGDIKEKNNFKRIFTLLYQRLSIW